MKNKAFTLVELITVIVILGILSAFAIPKFINLQQSSTKAADAAIFAAFKSAVHLAHAQWIAKGKPSTITIQNETIAMTPTGWPGTTHMSSSDCENLFDQIMDNNLNTTTSFSEHGKNTFLAHGEGSDYCRFIDARSAQGGHHTLIYRTDSGSFIQRI